MTEISSVVHPLRIDGETAEIQICVASTLYGVATLAAAVDAGQLSACRRRILVFSNNSATPETAPHVEEMGGFAVLATRFDAVHSYNEALRPNHPSMWKPRSGDLLMWEVYFRTLWDLGDATIRLVVESIQVPPALSLCHVFADAAVDVYADGLMSYGPTRNRLPGLVGTRIERLLHIDLVPGIEPLLLEEWGRESLVIDPGAFTGIIDALAADVPMPTAGAEPVALVLGQYLSALDILTPAEEAHLHLAMLEGCVRRGFTRIVFKPHPTSVEGLAEPMRARAQELGVDLVVYTEPVIAEVLFDRMRPALVVSCFSTALLTAATLYHLPVARFGTDLMLRRLKPYQNSNRIPVTVVDQVVDDLNDLESDGALSTPAEFRDLVSSVAYAMQPQQSPALRPLAARYLAAHPDSHQRYFRVRRLTALDLPGGSQGLRRTRARLTKAALRHPLSAPVAKRAREALRRARAWRHS